MIGSLDCHGDNGGGGGGGVGGRWPSTLKDGGVSFFVAGAWSLYPSRCESGIEGEPTAWVDMKEVFGRVSRFFMSIRVRRKTWQDQMVCRRRRIRSRKDVPCLIF